MSYLALLLICISLIGQGIRGISNLTDYMGCYASCSFAQEKIRLHTNNSRINCKKVCKLQSYRYAGTKDGRLCLCRDNLYTPIARDEECDIPCPMFNNETCGGRQAVQVYDTWPCRNEARCNGSKCVDIDGIEYKCKCEPGWTGKHCTEILKPGQDTGSKTTLYVEHRPNSGINSGIIVQTDNKWLTMGILVTASMLVINGIL